MEKHKFGTGVLQQELSEAENLEPSEAENMDVSDTCTDKPGTSSADSESEEYALASPNFVGPVQMFKYPKATERKKPSKRSGKTAILTSSPYKNGLCTTATETSHVNGTISKDEESKSTDSEDEECIVDLDDSDESESFDEMMEMERKEREELEDLMQKDTFKKGDYILVRFSRKKCIHCYVGEILDLEEEEMEVKSKFLKRNDTKNGPLSFSWPTKDDIGWHDIDDILLKLPKPKKVVGTSRTSEKLRFPCNFDQFESQLL